MSRYIKIWVWIYRRKENVYGFANIVKGVAHVKCVSITCHFMKFLRRKSTTSYCRSRYCDRNVIDQLKEIEYRIYTYRKVKMISPLIFMNGDTIP